MGVTIKDIASMANVSRGTVDRVLNNRGGVSPRTAERIRLIAEKMNYTPSITGRGLAVMKKDLKFGFILPAELNGNTSLNRALVQKTEEFAEYSITVLRRAYADRNVQELLKLCWLTLRADYILLPSCAPSIRHVGWRMLPKKAAVS